MLAPVLRTRTRPAHRAADPPGARCLSSAGPVVTTVPWDEWSIHMEREGVRTSMLAASAMPLVLLSESGSSGLRICTRCTVKEQSL